MAGPTRRPFSFPLHEHKGAIPNVKPNYSPSAVVRGPRVVGTGRDFGDFLSGPASDRPVPQALAETQSACQGQGKSNTPSD